MLVTGGPKGCSLGEGDSVFLRKRERIWGTFGETCRVTEGIQISAERKKQLAEKKGSEKGKRKIYYARARGGQRRKNFAAT